MKSLFGVGLVWFVSSLLQGCSTADVQTAQPPLFSPYKHVNMEVDPSNPVARTRIQGQLVTLVAMGDAASSTPLPAVTLAFASGECGEEHWGTLDAVKVAQANVASMATKRLKYMISTGGEGNVFTCHTDAGMEKFIRRYASSALLGIDFDIESTQTPDNIRTLVQRVKVAQTRYPHLRFSFTLATLATSDHSAAGLNATGVSVLQALRDAGVRGYYINLMVMDFGPAVPANCVVRAGHCDMAASARQAVMNLHRTFGVPLSQIEVTAMPGVNDVVENVFTLEDAAALAQFVQSNKLAGLHYWSLDRDKPCDGGANAVSPACSSLDRIAPLAYLNAFLGGLH